MNRIATVNNRVNNSSSYEKGGMLYDRLRVFIFYNITRKTEGEDSRGIYIKVDQDDCLIIRIQRQDGNNFSISFCNFSDRFLHGFTTDYATYVVMKEYKEFVLKQFFK